MIPLSNNHLSLDNQIDSAVTYLWHAPELTRQARQFRDAFPEYAHLVWQEASAWIDAEASKVDPEFMSWVADWIERFTPIFWEEGEPWLPEPGDGGEGDGIHAVDDRPDLAGNWFDHIEQGGA
jgi:hypothetical protein